ncbi:MAG: redoxin family protein [Candidatus Peregrinibacteria bacterium]
MVLLFTSFLAGFLTVLAPCVLPLLPVIVGGSLSGGGVNIKKTLTIVTSLGISVIVFTLVLKVSTLFITVPEYTWKLISGGIVLLLGMVTLFPSLWKNPLLSKLSADSNAILGKGNKQKSFWGDIIVGAALGPVFSTCSPTYFIILATVLPVDPLTGMLYLLVYTIGLSIALFIVAFIGQKIMSKLGVVADSHGIFKKVLGVLFILVGLGILTGFDKKIETAIINSHYFDVTKVEQGLLEKADIAHQKSLENSTMNTSPSPKDKSSLKKVPEVSSIDGYINTSGQPITFESLHGKVVLLDIWTYTCINCQRTLPYINDWYAKYHTQGFEVVGLHTPEFGFEKVQSNVEEAVKKFQIHYPVLLDNDYSTWNALGNRYWPRKYLIDEYGYIIYDHIGEGGYEETEMAIQEALKNRAAKMGEKVSLGNIATPSNAIMVDPGKVKSPEVYFGSARNTYLGNGKSGVAGNQSFSLPPKFDSNKLYLDGKWNMESEYAENTGPASVVFPYDAKVVNIVAGSEKGVDIEVYQDDALVKKVHIKGQQLYPLIEGASYGQHTLRIKIPTAGLQAFTFTFG